MLSSDFTEFGVEQHPYCAARVIVSKALQVRLCHTAECTRLLTRVRAEWVL